MMTLNIDGIKKLFETQDMTVGKPLSVLVKFSIPLLIGNFVQQLYTTVDSIIVGNYIGDNALAAVGASFPVQNLLLVFIIGISTGTTIMVAQYYGAKDRNCLSRTIGTCLILTFIASILIAIIGFLASKPIIIALQTPEEIRDMSIQYLQILLLGTIGGAYFNIISGVLRGMGDSIYPLFFLLIASVLNVFLDIIFITWFQMGVAGVALATIISQAISAILCIFRLYVMKSEIDLNKNTVQLDKKLAVKLGQLGLPASITQIIFSMANTIIQSLINSLGTLVIASTVVVMRVDGFAMMPNFTSGMATTAFVGQNIGAEKMDRVQEGTKDALKMGFIIAGLLIIVLLIFSPNLMRLFTNTDSVIAIGVRGIRTLAVGYIAFAGTQVLMGVMRGAGDTTSPMWISIFTSVIVRVPIAYMWAWLSKSDKYPNGSPDSLYVSLLIAWIVGFITTLIVYRKGNWKRRSII
jgi:putative MATE family efflux protein